MKNIIKFVKNYGNVRFEFDKVYLENSKEVVILAVNLKNNPTFVNQLNILQKKLIKTMCAIKNIFFYRSIPKEFYI